MFIVITELGSTGTDLVPQILCEKIRNSIVVRAPNI